MSAEFIKIILIIISSLINILAFIVMLNDKSRSRHGNQRISEGTLLFLAIAFGALGILSGMFIAHHKTQKMIFILGVPLALLQNVAFIYLAYDFITR